MWEIVHIFTQEQQVWLIFIVELLERDVGTWVEF